MKNTEALYLVGFIMLSASTTNARRDSTAEPEKVAPIGAGLPACQRKSEKMESSPTTFRSNRMDES